MDLAHFFALLFRFHHLYLHFSVVKYKPQRHMGILVLPQKLAFAKFWTNGSSSKSNVTKIIPLNVNSNYITKRTLKQAIT